MVERWRVAAKSFENVHAAYFLTQERLDLGSVMDAWTIAVLALHGLPLLHPGLLDLLVWLELQIVEADLRVCAARYCRLPVMVEDSHDVS
jgi:hypothetical protein